MLKRDRSKLVLSIETLATVVGGIQREPAPPAQNTAWKLTTPRPEPRDTLARPGDGPPPTQPAPSKAL